MQSKKLLQLADLLDTVPPERFNINHFASKNFTAEGCDTYACVAGWATTIFHDEGLELCLQEIPIVYYRRYEGIKAFAEFFDLSIEIAYSICSNYFYPTGLAIPTVAAQRIREIVQQSNTRLTSQSS